MKENKQQLWAQRIQEQKKSNLSQKQWCNENSINFHTFSYWKRKEQRLNEFQLDEQATSWVTLEKAIDSHIQSSFRIRIGEAVIEIDQPTEAMITSLIKVLMQYGS
jgi:hypothetical protein